jgi:RimJ/RimL family protein N-acetyltransferase
MVKRLLARSISRSLEERWQVWPFAGRVLAVFERACCLAGSHADVVALVLPEVDNGPLNVVVEGEPGLFAAVAPEMPASLVGNRLRVGSLEIDLDSAVAWEAQPAWDRLRACQQAIVERLPLVHALALRHAPQGSLLTLLNSAPLLAADLQSATLAVTRQAVESLQAGWDGDQAQLQAAASQLAGLGGGLTPAGDDFLVGVMLRAWLAHSAPQVLCQTLLEATARRTTALSAAFLQAAARGECSAPWHALLAALAEGADVGLDQAVQAVLAYGHTSGADALAGFLWPAAAAFSAMPLSSERVMQIRGEKVRIRTTTREDLADVAALWNDGRVMQWVGFPNGLGYDEEKMNRWFDALQANADRHHFVVYAESIGFCGEVYYAVDQAHGRASLDIKLVPQAQGQGLATDALKTLIRHVFETEKDVEVVWTEPWEANMASRKLYARCGLRPESRPLDLGPFESYWALSRKSWSAI